jgi:hypothetical protein
METVIFIGKIAAMVTALAAAGFLIYLRYRYPS